MKKVAGIYKITSPSGKVYIGQSRDVSSRWRDYRSLRNRGQFKLQNSLKKYGPAAHQFEVILSIISDEQSDYDFFECYFMRLYRDARIELLNLRGGGSRGKVHPDSSRRMVETRRARGSYTVSDALRRKWSEQKKGRPGTRHTEETKRLLSEINKGRKQSVEAREKNRRSQLGRKHPDSVKAKIGSANRGNKRPDLAEYNRRVKKGKPGHPHTEESKRLIGQLHTGNSYAKGRVQSAEERRKRSEITRLWWAKRKGQVAA